MSDYIEETKTVRKYKIENIPELLNKIQTLEAKIKDIEASNLYLYKRLELHKDELEVLTKCDVRYCNPMVELCQGCKKYRIN